MFIYFIMLVQSLIASGTHIVAKVVVRDIDPVTLTMLRSGIAAVGLCLLGYMRREKFHYKRKHIRSILFLSFLVIPVNQFLFLTAIKYTTPTNAALFYSTTPAVVILMSTIMGKEKLRLMRGLGVMIAFIGVCLIIFEKGINFNSEYMIGNILLIVAVLAWAYYTVQGRSLVLEYGAFSISISTMVLGTLMFIPIGVIGMVQYDYSVLTIGHWGGLLYLALGTSIIAYLIWYYALGRTTASKVAIFSNLQPVLTTILAWSLLGQPITAVFIIGGIIVICGIIITQYS